MIEVDPIAQLTGGYWCKYGHTDLLGIITNGFIIRKPTGGFPFTGGGGAGEERLERLKREDDEILFIIKEFIKWVS